MRLRWFAAPLVACFVGSASLAAPDCTTTFPSRIEIACWVGQKFVVLPTSDAVSLGEYRGLHGSDSGEGVSSADLAFHVVTVDSANWTEAADHSGLGHWEVRFHDDTSGKAYITQSASLSDSNRDEAVVTDFVLKRDIDEAASRFIGREMLLAVDLPSGLHRGNLVRVVSVEPGSNWQQPIRVYLETDSGEKGYVDLAISATNASRPFPKVVGDAALDHFSKPEKPFTARDRAAISHQQVYIGMSARAARESWGWPDTVNRTILAGHVHEQWVYGSENYLYFDNGKVTAIQN